MVPGFLSERGVRRGVPLTRAKSVEQLYEEVREYDLVLVPDAPLASAINYRLDRAHFGPFAITPRRLAAGRREEAEDRLAFLELVDSTDLDWKAAAHTVGNVLQCWEHRGSVDAILEYDAYATEATHTAVECLREFDTTSRRLTDYTIEDDRSVAVVGHDRLTTLEHSILPAEYDEIDQFTSDSFDQPPFRIFESTAAIVDALLDTVTADTADAVGVVLDASSSFSALVESAFEARGIPYYGGLGFVDDANHRAFLGLLHSAFDGRDCRVSDVRPVLTQLGMEIDIEHDEKRICDLADDAAGWLTSFQRAAAEHTFDSALEAYERKAGVALDAFRNELRELGVCEEPLTAGGVDRVHFYLQTYEVPVDRENEGVLLADATAATHVDRPLVFYLGLDDGWTHDAPRRPWVVRDRTFERNLQRFQLLLQNGVDQYYLVRDTAGGSPVTPCSYFEELLTEPYRRFSDLDSIAHARSFRTTGTGFETQPLVVETRPETDLGTRKAVDVDPRPVETISQSSLNTYVNCPRDYFFSQLVGGPDRDYFTEGNLFHDFAEFYVAHPDEIDERAFEEITSVMLERTGPFLREVDRSVRRTRYRIGLETIVAFLEAYPPQEPSDSAVAHRRGRNVWADHFGRPIRTSITERWFENEALGAKGKIDLVHRPTHLVDFKSGSRTLAAKVVEHASFDPPAAVRNYQAILYLAHQRTERPGERLQFTFVHFLETLDDAVVGEANLEDCLTTITYYPTTFAAHAATKPVFESLQEDGAGSCRKTFAKIEYETYREVLEANEFPDTSEVEELVDSALGRALLARLEERVGEYKYVDRGCVQACRYLLDIRNRNFFADDLDSFESFLSERRAELERRRAGAERFPIDCAETEPNYRRVNNRDLILETDDWDAPGDDWDALGDARDTPGDAR